MENLLNHQKVRLSKCALDATEECGYNGDYTLPEYCPDVAVVLKCFAVARLQNRQWSSGQMLLDGMVNLRVLYLDESCTCVHTVEFAAPYSCRMQVGESLDYTQVSFDVASKYVNCRAVGPRRLEVHGAVVVHMIAQSNATDEIAIPKPCRELHIQQEMVTTAAMIGSAEKIVTISETLEFPESLPPAERLLGGDCTVVLKECKPLTGKVIVRGQVHVHQLYTSDMECGATHCLDFAIPFSQVIDVSGAYEGCLCKGDVLILSDTERCCVGPDGENSQLEVTVKMLIPISIYETEEISFLTDAYHTQYPLEQECVEMECCAYCGCVNIHTVLPTVLELQGEDLSEIVDVWVTALGCETVAEQQIAVVSGKLQVTVLARERDNQLRLIEKGEDFRFEHPCVGNAANTILTMTGVRYRVVDRQLELQVEVDARLYQYNKHRHRVIRHIACKMDQPYNKGCETALLYYAQPGETSWEIGRSCHTSPQAIDSENELSESAIQNPCVLLVPIV